MVGSLAPQLSSDVAVEQPVASPSLLGGIADLAGGFLQAARPPATTSASSQLAQSKQAFYQELERARAGLEQGTISQDQADRIVRTAYRQFGSLYGKEYTDINEAFTNFTGISTDVEFTGDAFNEAAVAARPEFQANIALAQLTNPEADPQQVYQQALDQTRRELANEARIKANATDEKANWIMQEADYVERANIVGKKLMEMVNLADRDEILTPEESKQIKDYYYSSFGSLRKPVGVDQASWDKFQEEYIDPLTSITNSTLNFALNNSFSDVQKKALNDIIAKAISQGKLPSTLLMNIDAQDPNSILGLTAMLNTLSENPEYTENINFLKGATFNELLGWVSEFENQSSLDFFETLTIDKAELKNMDGSKLRNSLLSDSSLISPELDPGKSTVNIMNLISKVEALDTTAIQPEDFKRVFGNNFYTTLSSIYEVNPVVGRKLAERAISTVNSHLVTMSLAINSRANQLGLRIVDGDIRVDEDLMPKFLVDIVNREYGGDWNRAFTETQRILANPNPEEVGGDIGTLRQFRKILSSRKDILAQLTAFNEIVDTQAQLKELLPDGILGNEQTDMSSSGQVNNQTQQPSDTLSLIRDFEGFSETAYWDVNAYRAGYGSDTITKADGTVEKVTANTVVTREDAERDLARRSAEFAATAARQVGEEIWGTMPSNVKAALTSIAYNYGSLPDRIIPAAKSGDWGALAEAVIGLANDNGGINRGRREREAKIIAGGDYSPISSSTPPPQRPSDLDTSPALAPATSKRPAQRPNTAAVEGSTEPTQTGDRGNTQQAKDSPSMASSEKVVKEQILALKEAGLEPQGSIPTFDGVDAVNKLREAIKNGEVKPGDMVLVFGQVVIIPEKTDG